jgi:hypothetical protein
MRKVKDNLGINRLLVVLWHQSTNTFGLDFEEHSQIFGMK